MQDLVEHGADIGIGNSVHKINRHEREKRDNATLILFWYKARMHAIDQNHDNQLMMQSLSTCPWQCSSLCAGPSTIHSWQSMTASAKNHNSMLHACEATN